MEREISEIAGSLRRVGGTDNNTSFHEGSFEFDIPKLPIERNEMKNHLLSRQLARPAHGDQPSHFQASPNLTPKEARFRLSPVQFETPSEPLTNGNSSGGLKDASHLIAPLKTSEGDTKFHVDEEDDLRTNKVIPEVVRASPIRHLVEYQRVCIGEANTPGVTVDDLQEAAVALLKSMELRDKYMRASLQKNGRVAKRYLRLARLGSREELQPPRDAFYYTTSSSTRGMNFLRKNNKNVVGVLFVVDICCGLCI